MFQDEVTNWLTEAEFPFSADAFDSNSATQKALTISCIHGARLVVQLISFDWWRQHVNSLPSTFFQQCILNSEVADVPMVNLWEDVWKSKNEIVKSRLLALLGKSQRTFARKLLVRKITRLMASLFLEQNHLQPLSTSHFSYGLFKGNNKMNGQLQENNFVNLVAVATFGRIRKMKRPNGISRSGELLRFATLRGNTVVGGLDKLLTAFARDNKPDDIMTYVDLDWSLGEGFKKVGFKAVQDIPPQNFQVDPVNCLRMSEKNLPLAPAAGWLGLNNSGSRKYVRIYN